MIDPGDSELVQRAKRYADYKQIQLELQQPLGRGIDGQVWRTTRPSALKVLERLKCFQDELECYRRLSAAKIIKLGGFAVPELIDFDEELAAVEMTIVRPPFLLDFGKVYLDSPPPYWDDAEIMANWHAEGRENFGERWGNVLSLVGALQRYGIYYVDPKPGNIMFAD